MIRIKDRRIKKLWSHDFGWLFTVSQSDLVYLMPVTHTIWTQADGSCQFRAFAMALDGRLTSHKEVRFPANHIPFLRPIYL